MRPTILPLLRCTTGCEQDLDLNAREHSKAGEVIAGKLDCPGCGRSYPIEEGIIRMLPENLVSECGCSSGASSDRATDRKKSEMRARDAQVKDYDRMWYLNLYGKIEIPMTLKYLSLTSNHLLLEAGCGTGRMTPTFAGKCSRLVSVDFSWESLRTCAGKLQAAGIRNVDLVQADICNLPFRSGTFPRVVSAGVLEHIPTRECRETAVRDLARVLEPEGVLAISAYKHSLLTRLFGQKEGEHDGGIPFFRFSQSELRSLLSRAFKVESICGSIVYYYLARCTRN